jgi:pimeloyl-ACP methyl ester carboxylesterase
VASGPVGPGPDQPSWAWSAAFVPVVALGDDAAAQEVVGRDDVKAHPSACVVTGHVPFHDGPVGADEAVADLRRRIAARRWPSRELVADRSQGGQLATVQELARYWATDYDWRKCEAKLNALPQFTTEIDGLNIHFIHVKSEYADALPLIMTHGWPGSVIELLEAVGSLTDPTALGGRAEDAFDLVLPSLPGYGFSAWPAEIGRNPSRIARAWAELMHRLGYTRYVAQGGDQGAYRAAAGSLVVVSVGVTMPQHRAALFLDPGSDPREGGPRLGDERTTLNEFLRCQRLTLQLKCDGLDAGQLARCAVEPSTMSLLGLVRHMAEVERGWFRRRFAGLDVPRRYQTEADPDADFNGAVADPAVVEEAQAFTPTLQQRGTDDRFQSPDLLAQRGLGDEHPLCGVREAARIGQGYEVTHEPQLNTRWRSRGRPGQGTRSRVYSLHVGHLVWAWCALTNVALPASGAMLA